MKGARPAGFNPAEGGAAVSSRVSVIAFNALILTPVSSSETLSRINFSKITELRTPFLAV